MKKAHARVFRLKPGPHGDPRIALAARERARGAAWEALYVRVHFARAAKLLSLPYSPLP